MASNMPVNYLEAMEGTASVAPDLGLKDFPIGSALCKLKIVCPLKDDIPGLLESHDVIAPFDFSKNSPCVVKSKLHAKNPETFGCWASKGMFVFEKDFQVNDLSRPNWELIVYQLSAEQI